MSFPRVLRLLAGMACATSIATLASAQQDDNPVHFPVNVQADIYVPYGLYGGGGSFSFTDEAGSSIYGSAGGSQGIVYNTGVKTAMVIPNKDYIVSVTRSPNGMQMTVKMDVAVHNYRLLIDGKATNRLLLSGNGSTSFKFRLEYNGSYPLEKAPARLPGGSASEIVSDKPIWYVGLGSMRNGESAGAIGFRKLSFGSSRLPAFSTTPRTLRKWRSYASPASLSRSFRGKSLSTWRL